MAEPGFSLDRLLEQLLPRSPKFDLERPQKVWFTLAFAIHRWIAVDRCTTLAASVTLQTLLSVVPTAGVGMILLRSIDAELAHRFLWRIVNDNFVPEASRAADIADTVVSLGQKVNIQELGTWGFLVIVFLAYLLYSTLERTANEIWRVHRARPPLAQFAIFYAISTLGPVAAFFSLSQPLLDGAWYTPALTSALGLTLLNRMLPNRPVHWRAALVGGGVSAVLFEASKFGFGRYMAVVIETYEGLYGSFALIPIFVVWSYISWLIVLFGFELAYVIQHRAEIESRGFALNDDDSHLRAEAGSAQMAARFLLVICDNYQRRELGTSPEKLAERFRLHAETVEAVLERLEGANFVAPLQQGGFVPARPPRNILLREVFDALPAEDVDTRRDDALSDLFAEMKADRQARLNDLSLADLLQQERTAPVPSPPAPLEPPA